VDAIIGWHHRGARRTGIADAKQDRHRLDTTLSGAAEGIVTLFGPAGVIKPKAKCPDVGTKYPWNVTQSCAASSHRWITQLPNSRIGEVRCAGNFSLLLRFEYGQFDRL
jgi:hypothetical protein